jgi:[ribosomal protein S5]-alanine N-acetyltransferase
MDLSVRPWRDEEEDEFVALATDARVTAKVGDGSPWSQERARARFRRAQAVVAARRGCWWRVDDHRSCLVGLFVAELDVDGALEIGYWIAPELWGQGRATQLVGIAVPRLAEVFPGIDLRAETHLDNPASTAVLQRAGFVEEEPGVGRYDRPVRRFRREAPSPEERTALSDN